MTPRPHVPWLNHLRGLSSLVVCAAHTYNALVSPVTGLGHPVDRWMGALSTLAVYVFFVISGYAIALSILGNVGRNGGRFAARPWATDRLARLVPPLALAVLVTVAVYGVVAGLGLHGAESYRLGGEKFVMRERAALDWRDVAVPFLFLQTIAVPHGTAMNGALWSLGFEFWFYVMAAAFTVAAVNRRPVGVALLVLWGVGYAFTNGVLSHFVWYLPVWCAGGLMAVRLHHPRLSGSVVVRGLFAAVAMAGVGTLLWVVTWYGVRVLDVYRPGMPAPLTHAALSVTIAVLAGSAVGRRLGSRLGAGRLAAGLDRAADYSYTLYVVHFPLLLLAQSLIRPATHDWGFRGMVAVGVAVFVAVNLLASRVAPYAENRRAFQPLFRRALAPHFGFARLPGFRPIRFGLPRTLRGPTDGGRLT